MSKYIETKETTNIDKVEETFKAGYEEAEKKAREAAKNALEKIKHYKATSYEELAKAEEQEFEEILKDLIEHAKEKPSTMDTRLEDEIASTLNIKKTSERWKEAERIVAGLSAEEKFEKWLKIIKESLAENLKSSKENILETDILYDLMTEEQVEQYINLIYLSHLKTELMWTKRNSLAEASIAPKLMGKRDPEGYLEDNREYEVEQSAKKIVYVEEMSIKNRIDIEDIKEGINIGIGCLLGSSAFGGLIGIGSAFIAELANNHQLSENLFKSTPLFIAAVLACFGIPSIKEFIKNKQAIAEAKKYGLYDLIVEHYQAEKDVEDYTEKLKEIHGVEAKMGGMAI